MSLLIIVYYLVLQAIDKRHHEKPRSFPTEFCGPPCSETEDCGEGSIRVPEAPRL